jgi:hypothetical protein
MLWLASLVGSLTIDWTYVVYLAVILLLAER